MRWIAFGLVLAAAVTWQAGGARADDGPRCHVRPVRAQGGPSLLAGTARSRARAAWMRKVAKRRTLGPSYAAWLKSKDHAYACRRSGRYTSCLATATPCKVP